MLPWGENLQFAQKSEGPKVGDGNKLTVWRAPEGYIGIANFARLPYRYPHRCQRLLANFATKAEKEPWTIFC